MKNIGLVFSGGGGKGAYEIGVWKALKEFDIIKNIKAVSGTSVGALNGALFASNQYEEAEKVWLEMDPDKILKIDAQKMLTSLVSRGVLKAAAIPLPIVNIAMTLSSSGSFSQKGLESIIDEKLDFKKLKLGIPFYINTTRVLFSIPPWKAHYVKLNNINDRETIKKYLLASAAIPVVFSDIKIDGKMFYDGGLTDNTPIKPLAENENVDILIVVMLDNAPLFDEMDKKYKNIKMWQIVPNKDIGNFFTGTLNFNSKNTKKLLDAGYEDTKKILKDIQDMLISEKRYKDNADSFKKQSDGFKKIVLGRNEINKLFSGKSSKDLLNESINSKNLLNKSTNSKDMILSRNNKLSKNIIDNNGSLEELEKYKKGLDLAITNGEKAILDENIDKLIDEMKDNSNKLAKLAVESIAALASTNGRINNLQNQGFFRRMWNGLTGKNQKLSAGISKSQNVAIYANTRMVQKLSQRSALTMDALISINNKVNYMMLNINKLQLQQQETLGFIDSLRNSVVNALDYIENRIDNNQERIDNLENGQNLLFWQASVKSRYLEHGNSDKIFFMVKDYLKVTKNYCQNDEVHFFRSSVMNIIDKNDIISRKEFVKNILNDDKKVSYLHSLSESDESYTPLLVQDAKNISSGFNIEKIINKYDEDDELKVVDLATELLFDLKKNIDSKKNIVDIKTIYLNRAKKIEKFLKKEDFYNKILPYIDDLKKEINNFKLNVAIIGKNNEDNLKIYELLKVYNKKINFEIIEKEKIYNYDFIFLLSNISFIFDRYNYDIIDKLIYENNIQLLITKTKNKLPYQVEKMIKEIQEKYNKLKITKIDLKNSNINYISEDINQIIFQYEPILDKMANDYIKRIKEEITQIIKAQIKKRKALDDDYSNLDNDKKLLLGI